MSEVLNTYHVGYPDLSGGSAAFLAVLTRDRHDGTYAVYSGLVQLPDPSHESYEAVRDVCARMVAAHGSREEYDRASTFYPGIPKEEYRP